MRKVIHAELVPDDELLRLIGDWSSCLNFARSCFADNKSLKEVRQAAKQEYAQLTAGWVSSVAFCAKYNYSKVGMEEGKLKLWAVGGRCKQGNGLTRLICNDGNYLLRVAFGKRKFVMYSLNGVAELPEEFGKLLKSRCPYNVLLSVNGEGLWCGVVVSYRDKIKPGRTDITDIDEELLVKCQMCGAKLKRISSLHLRIHGVTLDEYLNLFPDAKISSLIWKSTLKKTATGRQFSKEVKEKLSATLRRNWANPKYRDRQLKLWMSALTVHPNKPEKLMQQLLDELQPNEWRFNNGWFILAGKIPDFVNINAKKQIIEVFGRVFHDPAEVLKIRNTELPWKKTELGTIMVYKSVGWDCLIVWEDELSDIDMLTLKLRSFVT